MNGNCICQLFDNNWIWLIILACILLCNWALHCCGN